MDGSDPIDNYLAIREELEHYDEALGRRPEIVAVTKAELPSASEVHAKLVARLDHPPLLISAVTGEGLNQLTHAIADQLNALPQEL